MKVLLVSNMWPSKDAPTRGLFVKEQLDSLESIGIEVTLLHFDASSDKTQYLQLPARLAARILREKPDIIHAHYGLTAAFCPTTFGRPLVATFHGSDIYIPWQRRFSQWAAKRAAKSICVSPELARNLEVVQPVVLPCGVNTEQFRPQEQESARIQLDLPRDRPIVLFPASRHNSAKNYSLFSRSIEMLSNSSVYVAELDGIKREDVPVLMNAADVMVLTSHYEGYCLAVTEALACGLPVLAVSVADVEERISSVPHCSIVPRDPQRIAEKIDAILEQRPRIQPVPRLDGLTSNDVANRLLGIYRELLGS